MPEPLRIHRPAVLQQGAQLLEPGFGEEGAQSHPARPDLDQAAIKQALDSRWDLRLVLLRTGTPGTQEDAVRDARVLAEGAAELRTWTPLKDARVLRETLMSIGAGSANAAEVEDWLALVHAHAPGPALIQAGRMGRDWMSRPHADPLSGIFLSACLWRAKGFGRGIALPFWSAPEQRHFRMEHRVGTAWLAGFMECIAEAARIGMSELERLIRAEEKGRGLKGTARSKLPAVFDVMLRLPIVTALSLARELDVTPQASAGLLRNLMKEGIIREATGRASWRAFTLT